MEAMFWRADEPDYDSDYRHTFINGALEHPFSLPGVRCEICAKAWGGSRILPIALPDELRNRKELTDRRPISGKEHQRLRSEIASVLQSRGHSIKDLRPGDKFQSCLLSVPSKPQADFLWASLGSVVVSERIRLTLEDIGCEGVHFCPVTIRKVGNRKATARPRIPASGEPEDMLNDESLREPTGELPQYFEMVLTSESKNPPGTEITSRCELCGREEYERRILTMRPDMWLGDNVFLLATTLWIVITEKVGRRLQDIKATNAVFRPL